ncbi:MAG: hypothetical protein GWP91_24505, partial [Rhodobacterales bacterium]|nr:hypothetical protein [Rhodobacterales bacterium]
MERFVTGASTHLFAPVVAVAVLVFGAPIQISHAADYALMAGGQVDAGGHVVLNFAVRQEAWQFSLYTDTLDARWTSSKERGKVWIGTRFAGGASGLMISPWTEGRPAPERALVSGYAGLEYGAQRYLSRGFYAGVEGHSRLYGFGALDTTTVAIPEAQPVLNGDLVLGWYRPFASVKVRPGLDLALASPTTLFQPHVILEAQIAPDWTVAPRAELRGGWADGQDDV